MNDPGLVSPLAERSRLRAKLWRFNRNRAFLYRALVTVRNDGGGRRFVRRTTDLVIDGFERSGNTFAVYAFVDANGPDLEIAHHTHSSAQFRWAARWQVPALLITRDPADVAMSVAVRWPARSPHEVVEDYIAFHERVARHRDRVEIAAFEIVTHDFGLVIDQVNSRFSTAFDRFAASDEATQRVYDAIERRNERRYGRVTEVAVARPSPQRRALTDGLRAALDRPRTARLVDAARVLRADLLGVPT